MSFDLGCFSFLETTTSRDIVLEEETLSWRMDPDKSLSDWNLVITRKSAGNHNNKDDDYDTLVQTSYPIHRTIFVTGPRSSMYFQRIFQNSTNGDKETTLEFEQSTADAIPAMLDFIYSAKNVDATSANAVALRHLAIFFGIPALFDNVNTFIQKDLTPITSPIYLAESAMYYDEKILNASFALCLEHFQTLDEASVARLSPKLFKKVVLSPDLTCDSQVLSRKVAAFWKLQPTKSLDTTWLKELTNSNIMPEIDPTVAVYFLTLSLEYGLSAGEITSSASPTNSSTENVEVNTVNTSLKSRSEVAATTHWDISLTDAMTPGNESSNYYEKLPEDIRIDLLEAALQCASKEQRVLQKEHGRFTRVPVDHKFDSYGFISHYKEGDATMGARPPTAMPTKTDQPLDGYLFHAGANVWPVFYYSV